MVALFNIRVDKQHVDILDRSHLPNNFLLAFKKRFNRFDHGNRCYSCIISGPLHLYTTTYSHTPSIPDARDALVVSSKILRAPVCMYVCTHISVLVYVYIIFI